MKNAIIIVGKFDYNQDILNEIKRCYSLDNTSNDIFIYNNNSLENNEKIRNYFDNNNINYVTIKSKQYSENKDSFNFFNTNKINIMKSHLQKFLDRCRKKNIINNTNLTIHVPFKHEHFFNDVKLSSPEQYEQIYLALNEVKNYESIHNFEYDYIMKIRMDFFLKHDNFGPLHYFNDKNDVLLKSYNNLKYYYDKIDEADNYHPNECRINNYLYWRTTKFLGGQFILNEKSYNKISDCLNDRNKFNEIITDQYVITINDACFFSSGKNFKKFMEPLYKYYGEFYDDSVDFWWTAECQLQLSILQNGLLYFDYLQNNNYYNGRESWVNDYHGIEKYDHSEMNTTISK